MGAKKARKKQKVAAARAELKETCTTKTKDIRKKASSGRTRNWRLGITKPTSTNFAIKIITRNGRTLRTNIATGK